MKAISAKGNGMEQIRQTIDRSRGRHVSGLIALFLFLAIPALADTVTFQDETGKTITVNGNVLVEDPAQTILLEGPDSQHYIISRREIVSREKSDKEVPIYSKQQLRKALEKEFGAKFKIHQTNNYMIVYGCGPDYARAAGTLFERAYAFFTNYFRNKGGFQFDKPKLPLVAVIYASREDYVRAIAPYLGPSASSTAGLYMPLTNRMYMYDAFGGQTGELLREASSINPSGSGALANALRDQNIATIIHEGIHQIAYNTGFHHRHNRNPLWLVEGMAMYFEAPDADSKTGWKGAGNINRERLEHFSKMYTRRQPDALVRLVTQDDYFRNAGTANDAYAEAWALTYYFARAKSTSYVKYLRLVNDRKPMEPYLPEERLRDFRTAFGKSPEDIEIDFRRFMSGYVGKTGPLSRLP